MNFIWNDTFSRNRSLFCARFPELSRLLHLDSEDHTRTLASAIPESYRVEASRSGLPTLSVNGQYLHSRYNPLNEAEKIIADTGGFPPDGCFFASSGLAWLPEQYAMRYPSAPLVLVEPDIFLFLVCLAARPLDRLLSHPALFAVVGASPRETVDVLDKLDLAEIHVHERAIIAPPDRPWFDEFLVLRTRNREKKEINANTLRRFGDLWLRNMSRNLVPMRDTKGIAEFAGMFSGIPALVLAAGPSLDRILPLLPELRQHCVVIAVDTAVRACVRAGVQPDFIVLVDPQYWNFRHLDGLDCPDSILITESAAWPAVFRFHCRAVFLCSSLFPLGKFLESRTVRKGELGAGGSVSTTAWDFARHLGAKKIYMAALDLGFPGKKTHFTGSIFEERTHTVSSRFGSAETAGFRALYDAGPYPVPDYLGGTVLTDKRLVLYAWWFESQLARQTETETLTITPEGVRIPGFTVSDAEEISSAPAVRSTIDPLLASLASRAAVPAKPEEKSAFENALGELKAELERIRELAEQGIRKSTSAKMAGDGSSFRRLLAELNQIDRQIMENTAKELAAMVFPADNAQDATKPALSASAEVYRKIAEAANTNLRLLKKFY